MITKFNKNQIPEGTGGSTPPMPEIDGKTYGIKDQEWSEIESSGGTIIDVEVDGQSVVEDGIAKITGLVPYESDGSISTKDNGGYKIMASDTKTDIIKVVEPVLTKFSELKVGDDLSGITMKFNNNGKPIKFDPTIVGGGGGSISTMQGAIIFQFSANDSGNSISGSGNPTFGWPTQIYSNGSWTIDEYTFPEGCIIQNISIGISGPGIVGSITTFDEAEALMTSDSWKFSDGGFSYPSPNRLQIGNDQFPIKFEIPSGNRLLVVEGDTEHTVAYTDDLIDESKMREWFAPIEVGRVNEDKTEVELSITSAKTNIHSNSRPIVTYPNDGIKDIIDNPNVLQWSQFGKDPSPIGWRLPSMAEVKSLVASGYSNEITIEGIKGWAFGQNLDCFFPENGSCYNGVISAKGQWGYYWTTTPFDNTNAYYLAIDNTYVYDANWGTYTSGMGLRCVRDTNVTDYTPCPAGEVQIGDIIWAKSNLASEKTFCANQTDYGAYFQWGSNVAVDQSGSVILEQYDIAYTSDILPFEETVAFDTTTGVISAGEHNIGYVDLEKNENAFGVQNLHTNITSVDRPEVINPPEGVKLTIQNPDLFTWANGNADFKDPSPKGWRIPTRDELVALDAAGRGAWTQLNGINGRYLGGGTNIFFPAAGCWYTDGWVDNPGMDGVYWSSTPYGVSSGYGLFFGSSYLYPSGGHGYAQGLPIRCIRDTTTTDFEPCPAGEYQIGNIIWAKSNLSDVATFAQNPEDYGAYFQWGQNVAIGGDGKPLSVKHKIAYLSDIPTLPPPVRFNVTNMFTFNPEVPGAKVWLRDDGQQMPEIEIFANNSSNNTSDLTITAVGGFGSYFDNVGQKAYTFWGKDIDSGASGAYDVTVTGETDIANTVITVPKEINHLHLVYSLGSTLAPKASYWVDRYGVTHPFELENTPLDGFVYDESRHPLVDETWTINGQEVKIRDISEISFGHSYSTITEIPQWFLVGMAPDGSGISYLNRLDISGFKSVIKYNDCAFYSISTNINIGDIDSTIITSVGQQVFSSRAYPDFNIYANTQTIGQSYKDKFPMLANATIVVNS